MIRLSFFYAERKYSNFFVRRCTHSPPDLTGFLFFIIDSRIKSTVRLNETTAVSGRKAMKKDFENWAINHYQTGENICRHREKMARRGGLKEKKTQAMVISDLEDKGLRVSATSYSGWENGTKHPTLHSLLALCRVFDCCLDDLVVINDPAGQKKRQVRQASSNYKKTKMGWDVNGVRTGERIKRHRLALNLSQDDMVDNMCGLLGKSSGDDKAGISKEAYLTWEKGTKCPTVRNLLALCEIFDCRLDDLVVTDDQAREMGRQERSASYERS